MKKLYNCDLNILQRFFSITKKVPIDFLELDDRYIFVLKTKKEFNKAFSCITELQKHFVDKYPYLYCPENSNIGVINE